MKVLDNKNGQIEFLHVLMSGPAGHSYGVKVAELAGIPKEITIRAASLLKNLEGAKVDNKVLVKAQMSLFDKEDHSKSQMLIDELKKFPIQKSSPLQALNKIAEWQEKLDIDI